MRKLNLILLALFMATPVYAAAPTRAFNYVAHTTIDPAQVNTNENSLYSYVQAGVDTYASGTLTNDAVSSSAAISYSKLNLIGSVKNADISASAGIIDSKLAQITTTSKVSGAALTGLASIPSGAGVIPTANIPAISNIQIFTSSSTFTAPAGITKVYISMVGGGGAGGGGTNIAGGEGGGGGGGAYAINVPYTVVPANNYTVTIGTAGVTAGGDSNGGNGGTTSFDSLSVLGGSGGVKGSSGGAGGAGGVGSLNGSGATGGGYTFSGGAAGTRSGNTGGGGGGTPFGTGQNGSTGNQSAVTAGQYGTGSGGARNDGANGSLGVVIVMY